MRKITVAFIFLAAGLAAQAQDGFRNNAVKLNPLSLFLLTGNAAYERAVSTNQTVQVGVFYSGVSISGIQYNGLGITPEYRFYFGGRKEAFNGVYAAPFARYQNFKFTNKSTRENATFSSVGGGAVIGWEKMWDGGFVLDLFAGPIYNSGNVKTDANEDQFDLKAGVNGFGARLGISLGFGF